MREFSEMACRPDDGAPSGQASDSMRMRWACLIGIVLVIVGAGCRVGDR